VVDMLPAFYLVGLLSCQITRQRVRIGDMAAGTILVLDQAPPAQLLARLQSQATNTPLDPRLIELAAELVERWASLATARRAQLARQLLARAHPDRAAESFATLTDGELRLCLSALQAGDPVSPAA